MYENMTTPNEYDMLWLTNMKQVMGSKMWMWPLPFVNEEMKGQGYFYPKIPDVNMSDMNNILKESARAENDDFDFDNNEFDIDPKLYITKALNKYGGNTFVISAGADGGQAREVYLPTEAQRQ